ncbi:hypothetical protein Tco_0534274 [Tanacetum coccineum]
MKKDEHEWKGKVLTIGFSFFLQMGFTLILATLDGLDVGLLEDVIGKDDCDDDDCDEEMSLWRLHKVLLIYVHSVIVEEGISGERVESAMRCLLHLDPASNHASCSTPFRCKKIRDTTYSYKQKLAAPSMNMSFVQLQSLVIRKQAAASTQQV